ncbi:hypothetical protein LCGC14_0218040 [marine sediment metagenome]|uniref:Uncharacterized protein n=1 Tax=marine sediment metagenome TaxID=412755 RepID=A0A0F9WYF1_9ZZZZ|nr:hypothetical protein [Maribacter sp.]HDZ04144.1 hypothetical protein [Maribacter sp.]
MKYERFWTDGILNCPNATFYLPRIRYRKELKKYSFLERKKMACKSTIQLIVKQQQLMKKDGEIWVGDIKA